MANSLRFRAFRPVIVFSFCFLVIFLRPNVSSATRDKYRGPGPHDDYVHVTALDGESGGATLGVDGRSELCNIDMSSFLPPPYNNNILSSVSIFLLFFQNISNRFSSREAGDFACAYNPKVRVAAAATR